VVGVSGDQPGGQAFRWVNGTMTGLGFLPGANTSTARGVNADARSWSVGPVINSCSLVIKPSAGSTAP